MALVPPLCPYAQAYAPWGASAPATCASAQGLDQHVLRGSSFATPAGHATLDDLFDALDWVAPGFEVVQSHRPDWKFTAAETVADGALHARLVVGARVPVAALAPNAPELDRLLAQARVRLMRGNDVVEQGSGEQVLDSPLRALHHFVQALRSCPGAPDLVPKDVVTTGTWTDAWPIQAGETWTAAFTTPLSSLRLTVR